MSLSLSEIFVSVCLSSCTHHGAMHPYSWSGYPHPHSYALSSPKSQLLRTCMDHPASVSRSLTHLKISHPSGLTTIIWDSLYLLSHQLLHAPTSTLPPAPAVSGGAAAGAYGPSPALAPSHMNRPETGSQWRLQEVRLESQQGNQGIIGKAAGHATMAPVGVMRLGPWLIAITPCHYI